MTTPGEPGGQYRETFIHTRRAAVACVALIVGSMPAASAPDNLNSNNNNSEKLRNDVTVGGILEHDDAFQSVVDADGGNRIAGSPGHENSAQYVYDRAEAAGYDVSFQDFDYDLTFLADCEAPVLSIVGGTEFVAGIAGSTTGGDFGSMFKSSAYGTNRTQPAKSSALSGPDPAP
jgi:hypothetical protein